MGRRSRHKAEEGEREVAWQRKGFQIIFVLVLVVEVEVDGDIDEVFVLVIVFLGCRGSSQPAHLLIIVAGLVGTYIQVD